MESANHSHVYAAIRDLQLHTLSRLPAPLAKLLYLAGLRDYNTGMYHHEGLASRYSDDAACEALAECHRHAFRDLLSSSLEETVQQLESYMHSLGTGPGEFFFTWNSLKPYQIAVPAGTDPLSAEFLSSNLKVALAILESRFQAHRPAARSASPRL
jgi:hypothetical protein